MELLILGLIVFFSIHLVPSVPAMHARLIARMGRRQYRAFFSVVAVIGFVLIVIGKSRAPFQSLYLPPPWGRHATMSLVLLAMILLPAAYMPTNIRRVTPHPMLWAVIAWGTGHLLANGDVASVLLFGSFVLFAMFDIVSANRRGATSISGAVPIRRDIIVVAAGLTAYLVFLRLHPYLFGVPVLRI